MYTHLELSSQWKLIHLKRRKKGGPSNFRCAKFSVCGRNKCVCWCVCVCVCVCTRIMCVHACVCCGEREVDFKCRRWWTQANSWPWHVICSKLIIAVETRRKDPLWASSSEQITCHIYSIPQISSSPSIFPSTLKGLPLRLQPSCSYLTTPRPPLSIPILSVSFWRTRAGRWTTYGGRGSCEFWLHLDFIAAQFSMAAAPLRLDAMSWAGPTWSACANVKSRLILILIHRLRQLVSMSTMRGGVQLPSAVVIS